MFRDVHPLTAAYRAVKVATMEINQFTALSDAAKST